MLVLGVAASSPALVGSLNAATNRATVSATDDTRSATDEPSTQDPAAEPPAAEPLSRGSAGAAQALDLPLAQVDAALRSGADLGALADERGVDRSVLASVIVHSATEQINAQVTAGGLTRDRADQLIAQLPQQVDTALGVATPPQTAMFHPAPGNGMRTGQPDTPGPATPPPPQPTAPAPAHKQPTPVPRQPAPEAEPSAPPAPSGQTADTSNSAPQLPGEQPTSQRKGPSPTAPSGARPPVRSQFGGHAASSNVQPGSSPSDGSQSSGPGEENPGGGR